MLEKIQDQWNWYGMKSKLLFNKPNNDDDDDACELG